MAIGADHRILIGTIVFVFVDVMAVLFQRIQEVVLEGHSTIHPYLRSFLKSCSLMIFLLKLAVDTPWKDAYGTSNMNSNSEGNVNSSYTALCQDEDGDNFFDDASFVPTAKPGDVSDDGSDKSSCSESPTIAIVTRSKKVKPKVRFSKFSEVRTLAASEADEALFARLSYQATLKAEEEAARLAQRMPLTETAKLALHLALILFMSQFFHRSINVDHGYDLTPFSMVLSCLFAIILIPLSATSTVDHISPKLLASYASCIISLYFISRCLNFVPTLSYLASRMDLTTARLISSAICDAIFVVSLRRQVMDVDRLDIPSFMGLLGFFQVLLTWPGFFFISSDLKSTLSNSLPDLITILLSDILFMAVFDCLSIWCCLSTSSMITMVSATLRLPLTVLLKNSLPVSLTSSFWIGSICLVVSYATLSLTTYYSNTSISLLIWLRSRQKEDDDESYSLTEDS